MQHDKIKCISGLSSKSFSIRTSSGRFSNGKTRLEKDRKRFPSCSSSFIYLHTSDSPRKRKKQARSEEKRLGERLIDNLVYTLKTWAFYPATSAYVTMSISSSSEFHSTVQSVFPQTFHCIKPHSLLNAGRVQHKTIIMMCNTLNM